LLQQLQNRKTLDSDAMTPQERQWHWAEGNKYALECMKSLLLLNGGGAIALLTFFGNRARMLTTTGSEAIGDALFCFGLGTTGSVVVFITAYLTQLDYGNLGTERPKSTRGFLTWHNAAYVALLVALGGFIVGVWFARRAVVAALT
jgi:hypothetical protein